MTDKLSIGIVGGGAVGRAIAAFYPEAKIYDKYRPVDGIVEVAAADIVFIAVPTPFEQGPDLREMDDAVAQVVGHLRNPKGQLVVIKSTVVPGTTETYQKRYPEVNFLFNPEFLTEKTAVIDFAKPDKQVVGYTSKTREFAPKLLSTLPPAENEVSVTAIEAELGKYAINSYYAFKVIFANMLYDFTEALSVDYDEVRRAFTCDQRIVDSHFDVMHAGYRGYAGKCLPKDIKTLSWFSERAGSKLDFINEIIRRNEILTEKKII